MRVTSGGRVILSADAFVSPLRPTNQNPPLLPPLGLLSGHPEPTRQFSFMKARRQRAHHRDVPVEAAQAFRNDAEAVIHVRHLPPPRRFRPRGRSSVSPRAGGRDRTAAVPPTGSACFKLDRATAFRDALRMTAQVIVQAFR